MKRRGWGLRTVCALLLAATLTATAFADELILEPAEQAVEELPEMDLGDALLPEADAPAPPVQEAIVPDGGIIQPEETAEPAGEVIQPEETVEPTDEAIQPEETAEPADEAIQPEETVQPDEPEAGPEPEPTADPEPEPTADPEPDPTADPDAQVMAPEPAKQASGLRLNAESRALGLGERFVLTPQTGSSDGAPVTYRFASSNRKVAKVSAAGVVTAKKRGGAVITVAASTGETATCTVRVFKAPTSVKLNAKAAVLGFDAGTGAGMQFALQPRLSKKSASALSYYGYDSRVVSVSAEGVITAKGVGRTRITARTYNNRKAKIWITVLPAPKSFSLDAGLPQLCVQERRAVAVRLPANTAASVRFASDNPAVASADAATGEITARAVGEATITATAFNGVSAACRVRVLPGPDSVALSEKAHILGKRETFRLTAVPRRADGGETTATVRYVTSNRKVAVVAADGTVKGKKKGSAVITAIAPNGAKAECRVTVKKAPASIRLNAKGIWMEYDAKSGLGAQFQLTPKITKGSVSKISYTGYNAAVVSVSPNGLVTAVGVGTTTVTARTFNGKSAKCKVAVKAYGVKESSYRAAHPVQVMAHRGGAGYWPENTLEAFSKAGSKGADGVELDVFTSSDGVEFVYHSLNMKVNGKKYNVTRCTMAQLRKLKPDICTLDEALKVVAGSGMKLWLDLKAGVDGADCVAAVKKWGLADRTVYVSFNLDRLALVRAADASARLSYTFEGVPKNLSKIIADYRLYGVSPGTGCVTRALIDAWHRAGLVVGVWTPNEIMQIKALRDMGVDVICTDYPDRADAVR